MATTIYGEEIEALADDYIENWRDLGDAVPQIAGLAAHMHITRQCLYGWERDNIGRAGEWLEAVRRAQERELINHGLRGTFNSRITCLLMNTHGYSEKVSSHVTTDGSMSNAPVQIIVQGALFDDQPDD
jgi:hypothetical protein